MTFDAIVLCGGAGRRLGGPAKVSLEVGGRRLVDRVAHAAAGAGAAQVVAVGPELDAENVTAVAREDPPGAGPVAAIAAGLLHVTAPRVAVLAGDLALLTPSAVCALVNALDGHELAVAVDTGGRDQLLCAAWQTPALEAALAAVPDHRGAPVRQLVAHARTVARLADLGDPPPWFDCDTPEHLVQAARWAR